MSDQFENIPDELKDRDQWLFWNASNDTPRAPLDEPTSKYGASWSDPEEWLTFDHTVERAREHDDVGIGFINAADNDDYARGIYGSIDIDGCVDDEGRPKDWVPSMRPFFERDAYVEYSPSGKGLRIPIAGIEVPDWWADRHFTAEDHEGVEVLTNKFSTYTGNQLRGSGDDVVEYGDWLDEWLVEAHKAVVGDDPLANKSVDPDDAPDSSSAGQPGDRDEWMTEEVAEEALDAISADVDYDTWKDIGMALANHFGTSTGGSLFKSWSRGGSKWDSEAERQADRIIDDASGYNYGIGTLIKHASGSGWDASAAARRSLREMGTDTDEDSAGDGEAGIEPGAYTPIEETDVGLRIEKVSKDGEVYYEKLTNFHIDVDAILERDDETKEFLLTIDPAAEPDTQIAVRPKVFNDVRRFERTVCGATLSGTFDGGTTDLNRLKEYVAQQDAPVRRGTEHIGLHDDEWVVPDGTLTADGWTDDPGAVFESDSTPLSNKVSLTPDQGDGYDTEEVREILKLLPKTRLAERLLPALGWFYAAATRPYIQQWEGEFNILAVTGDTGAGKTATMETLWSAFGVNGDLLRADGTAFPKMRALATSNALPVVFDEYKPADMSSYAVDQFHSYLRTSTRGGIEEKGRPDGSVVGHQLLAPAVIVGEQALRGTAEERRTLQTNFSRQASVGGTSYTRAFTELTGGDLDGDVVEGRELREHAMAYYQWVLDRSENELRAWWLDARSEAADAVAELGITGLDDMRLQAIQTLIYGCRLYEAFASDMGVDETPIGDAEIGRAVEYILDERTATEHVSNLDRLLELAGRAAAAGYLERGEHFEIVREGQPDEELRLKLSLLYDKIRRYARDHDIQDADLLDSSTDYQSRIADAAEDGESYIEGLSVQTRGLNRCVAVSVGTAESTIEGFEREHFHTDGEHEETADDGSDSIECIGDLEPGRTQPVTLTVNVTSMLEPAPWLQGEGILQDSSGVIRYISRGSGDVMGQVEEGDRVECRDAMVTTNEDGAVVLELIDGVSDVVSAASAGDQSGLQDAASTDGGESINETIDDYVRVADEGATLTVSAAAGELSAHPDDVAERFEILATEKGMLQQIDDEEYKRL